MTAIFQDRREAGRRLAEKLKHCRGRENLLLLALPRGGVPVGWEVARELGCPLDILLVRKIGCPGNPELAAGAVSETGALAVNEDVLRTYGISREYFDQETARQQEEIRRRMELYRKGENLPSLAGKTVILVDDGVATGATLKAAIATLRQERLDRLIAALPVAPPETAREIEKMVDEWICLETPAWFAAVGAFYRDFTQVSDAEVAELLRRDR